MDKGTKFRILYLYQILVQYSDSEHPISTMELIRMLKEKYDIDVNRNTIGKDLDIMDKSGLHIKMIRSTQNKYFYDGQTFNIPELKLLVDAIAASKFITERKSEVLIGKLLSLANEFGAAKLRRHLYTTGRVKSDNEKGYYIVDVINDAIDLRRKISFQYTEYNTEKQRILKNDGKPYVVSPYSLIWDGDYYYVIGFSELRNKLQTFRLDRIDKSPEILDEPVIPMPEDFDLATYHKAVFRMYDTDKATEVTLFCENFIMRAIIDNFGLDVKIKKIDNEHFEAHVNVCTSPTFYQWVFGWNGKMKILKPESVLKEYRRMAKKALE